MRRLQKVRSFKELDGNKNGERTSAYFEKTSISPPSQNSHLLKSRQSLALHNLQQSHSTFPVIFFAQDSRKIKLISSVERSSASSFPSRTLQIALFYYHNRNQKYVSWTWSWTIFIGCVFHHRNHNRSDVVDSSRAFIEKKAFRQCITDEDFGMQIRLFYNSMIESFKRNMIIAP